VDERPGVIIAGGKGSRQGRLSDSKPKHVLPVLNRPLIEYQVDALSDTADVDVSYSRHNREYFDDYFEDRDDVDLDLDEELKGPLLPLFERAEGAEEDVVAMTGDAYTFEQMEDVLEYHESHDRPLTIGLTRSYPSPKACVFQEDDGVLQGFYREDGTSDTDDLINLGMYVASPEAAERLEMDRDSFKEDDVFPELFEDGDAAAYVMDDTNVNINTPYHLLAANIDALEKVSAGAAPRQVEDAVLEGNELYEQARVMVSEQADVADDPEAYDNAVIGDGAEIGDDVSMTNAVVDEGAYIEPGAELENVVVGHDAYVEAGEYEDTVIVGDGQTQPIDMHYDFGE
jgi:NDP-sugar pyrophosphorylase family protein